MYSEITLERNGYPKTIDNQKTEEELDGRGVDENQKILQVTL